MLAEKNFFLQLYNTILQRAKKFLNVNLKNLENIKQQKGQPKVTVHAFLTKKILKNIDALWHSGGLITKYRL